MAGNFSLHGELTVEGLRAMRDQIDALLSELEPTSDLEEADRSGGSAERIAKQKAARLRRSLGDSTWGFLYAAAANFQEGFTFSQLAEVMDEQIPTIRAWHRGASKVINRLNAELGKPPVFEYQEWDGAQNTYWMSPSMRDAILAEGE